MLSKIKKLCKAQGISVQQLEEDCSLGKNTVTRWGENVPAVDKVKRVADRLNCTVDELLKEE